MIVPRANSVYKSNQIKSNAFSRAWMDGGPKRLHSVHWYLQFRVPPLQLRQLGLQRAHGPSHDSTSTVCNIARDLRNSTICNLHPVRATTRTASYACGSGACDSAPNAMRALRARAHTDTAATRSFTAFAVRDKASERSHARAASTAASALSKSPVRARRRDAHERMPRCAAAAGRMTLCTQRRTALLPHRVEPRDALRKRDHSRACSERVCSCCCR